MFLGVNVFLWGAGLFAVCAAWCIALMGKWLVHWGILGVGPRGTVTPELWQKARLWVRLKLRYYATWMVVFIVLAAAMLVCYVLFGRG